jgi:hypothetical protein
MRHDFDFKILMTFLFPSKPNHTKVTLKIIKIELVKLIKTIFFNGISSKPFSSIVTYQNIAHESVGSVYVSALKDNSSNISSKTKPHQN